MVEKGELDVDAALALLALEASPGPSPELTARVMADAAVTILVREVHAAAPAPSPALVTRVLADAAGVAAARPVPAPAPLRAPRRRRWLGGLAVGWAGGALASLALALAIGIGIGLETSRPLPVLDRGASADPLAIAMVEPGLMLVDGL